MSNEMAVESAPASKPLILIVDDVAANLHVLSAELRAQYRIKVALNGPSALHIARHADDPPDLVLLDVMMPDMGGHQVLQHLRDDPRTADIPVILVTADTSEGSEVAGLHLGAFDFLNKPIDVPVMKARVQNLVVQRQMHQDILRARIKLQAMLDSSMQFIALLDLAGHLLHINKPIRDALALGNEALPVQALWDVPPWPSSPDQAAALRNAVQRATEGQTTQFGAVFDTPPGGRVDLAVSLRPVLGHRGEAAYVLFEARDVSEQRKAEQDFHYLSNNDSLTGLANRNLLARHVHDLLQAAGNAPFVLLRVELGRFRDLHEAFGQDLSDALLRQAADRIVGAVRQSDTVARVDSAGFAVLLPGAGADGAASVARKLLRALGGHFQVLGHDMQITPVIGVALAPADGANFPTLLKCAEMAASRYDANNRTGLQFFAAEMEHRLVAQLRMESLLRQAVGRRELALHYQPQVDLSSGECIGVEALLRWNSKELGPVSPLDFIGLAESTGLINELGDWVLTEAVGQMRRWRDAGVPVPCVAINLSAVQLQQADIVESITRVLQASGLPPQCLEIELTESAAFADPAMASARIQSMREHGLRIAIDDFGTGYSSLSQLQRIRIDTLKIDRSFVQNLGSAEGEALLEAMLSMAQALKICVLAEGVETRAQSDWLASKGCTMAQGYLFSRPLPAPALGAWLEGLHLCRAD